MAALGELERSVMDQLWSTPAGLTAYDLVDLLPADAGKRLAPTTVLTVLSRLEKKGFVTRERSTRPHRYTAVASRADHSAELMRDVLDGADDRVAVLERFVGQVSPAEADALRELLLGRARDAS
ncbi:BlaI/MecI/CopY family transcriptional regulator [Schumannella soli]|uniref:BlaI/MecI/CopY family transcriptional regulator n=1 Tax=Schumannella soli TaxID=2590779 RepID=A0A506XU04_9MICO|nr:BlaI/MecI/CopY family transcriptional regulator [Schumannella soli]TPW76191.1 BlaI/MecI/CopY family transcriptional regulator [Schumannella soli]